IARLVAGPSSPILSAASSIPLVHAHHQVCLLCLLFARDPASAQSHRRISSSPLTLKVRPPPSLINRRCGTALLNLHSLPRPFRHGIDPRTYFSPNERPVKREQQPSGPPNYSQIWDARVGARIEREERERGACLEKSVSGVKSLDCLQL
ncbi:hypothetical protein C8R44DRAFT_984475, partial [Mycena epipterygia]